MKSWGDPRQQARRVQHAAQHRRRCAGQHLCRGPRQPPHPGVRRRRQVPARSSRSTCRSTRTRVPAIGNKPDVARSRLRRVQTMAPGAPWAMCITPGPNQVLYTSDAYPGPRLQADARRQGARRARRSRQAAQAVRLDSRDRVPVGERALRRRAAELARAEARSCIRSSRRPRVDLVSLIFWFRRRPPC